MEAIIYRTNEKEHLRRESAVFQTRSSGEAGLLRFYPQEQRQRIIGFGGAFTESAGYVFSKMSEKLFRRKRQPLQLMPDPYPKLRFQPRELRICRG